MIAIKRILVPTDFSRVSLPAIRYALSLAKDHGARVYVLHAIGMEEMKERVWPDNFVGSAWLPERPRALDELVRDKAMDLQRFLDDMIEPEILGIVKVAPLVRLGEVVEEVIAAASELKSDLIVMTSRKRSWLERIFSRSLTQQVVRLAPCPVISIQPWAKVRTEKGEWIPIGGLQVGPVASHA